MHRRTLLTAAAGLAAPTILRAAVPDDAVKIRELYNRDGSMSDLALARDGKRLVVEGFMAPPLQANSNFFVQTKMPMSVCPFCETETEWPDDILAVYTRRIYDVEPFNVKLVTAGRLELGSYRDPDTGFLSLVRLEEATFERAY